MRTHRIEARAVRALLWLAPLASCSISEAVEPSGEVVVEDFAVERQPTGALRGSVTVTVTNTGGGELRWWVRSQPPVIQRLAADGSWVIVWHGLGILSEPDLVLRPGESETHTFGVSSGRDEWPEPYQGQYRIGTWAGFGVLGTESQHTELLFSEPFPFDPS